MAYLLAKQQCTCNQVLTPTLTEHLLSFFYSPLAFVFVLSISASSPTLTLIFAPEWAECTRQGSQCTATRGEMEKILYTTFPVH